MSGCLAAWGAVAVTCSRRPTRPARTNRRRCWCSDPDPNRRRRHPMARPTAATMNRRRRPQRCPRCCRQHPDRFRRWAGAFHRSALVTLDVPDQEGRRRVVPVPFSSSARSSSSLAARTRTKSPACAARGDGPHRSSRLQAWEAGLASAGSARSGRASSNSTPRALLARSVAYAPRRPARRRRSLRTRPCRPRCVIVDDAATKLCAKAPYRRPGAVAKLCVGRTRRPARTTSRSSSP
jgi:hypothetical protein